MTCKELSLYLSREMRNNLENTKELREHVLNKYASLIKTDDNMTAFEYSSMLPDLDKEINRLELISKPWAKFVAILAPVIYAQFIHKYGIYDVDFKPNVTKSFSFDIDIMSGGMDVTTVTIELLGYDCFDDFYEIRINKHKFYLCFSEDFDDLPSGYVFSSLTDVINYIDNYIKRTSNHIELAREFRNYAMNA